MSKHKKAGGPSSTSKHVNGYQTQTSSIEDELSPKYDNELDIKSESKLASLFNAGSASRIDGASVAEDGRINIDLSGSSSRWSKLLGEAFKASYIPLDDPPPQYAPIVSPTDLIYLSKLNIVIQLVGSRGDVQPFLPIGLELQKSGHRVRIATHETFRRLVENAGLEFFSIGGDPADLMSYMVRNPGLLPAMETIRSGEVQQKQETIRQILQGCWRSCYEAEDDASSPEPDKVRQYRSARPFVADAIIANPPSFAHIHCAERLGIPVHVMMPWSPTRAFGHPLANIKSSGADSRTTNYLSYILVEMLTWRGIGGVVNSFRRKALGLQPIDSTWAPGLLSRLKIPHTYLWSLELIPKPRDWGQSITVAGFCFSPQTNEYQPDPELRAFLQDGPPPIYIGFGSVVVSNPQALTALVFEAIELAGVRAIVSHGWSDLGGQGTGNHNILLVGDCPHDWLFDQVSCIVHHGGAGTTAAAVAAGKPSVIVPFFGDQAFWGSMISCAGAGPSPIPYKTLSAFLLAEAITVALSPTVRSSAVTLADRIRTEHGAEMAVRSFHHALPLGDLSCSLSSSRAAAWWHRKAKVPISALAVTVLRKAGSLDMKEVELYRPCSYEVHHGPWEPISGGGLAVTGLFYDVFKGFGEIGADVARMPRMMDALARTKSSNSSVLTYSSLGVAEKSPAASPVVGKKPGTGAVKGVSRIVKATVRAPMTFTMGMTQGAHNAPRLWGDKTVRPQPKITGVGSGLVAAGKEFVLNTYDGLAGLVVQPIIGARDGGVVGLAHGLASGLAGLPIKWIAAMSGTVGYPLKGLDEGVQKAFRGRSYDAVTAGRVAQGEWDFVEATEAEKEEIRNRWREMGRG